MFAWMLFIFQCCEDEANDTDRGLFGCSRKYPEHYSLLTNDGDHGSESMDGIYIVEGKTGG